MNLLDKLEEIQETQEKKLEDIAISLGRDIATLGNFQIQEDVYKARIENIDAQIDYWSK